MTVDQIELIKIAAENFSIKIVLSMIIIGILVKI